MKRIFYTTIMLCSSVVLCMKRKCDSSIDLPVSIVKKQKIENEPLGAFFACLPEDVQRHILFYATCDAFKWASLFAIKQFFVREVEADDVHKSMKELWPTYKGDAAYPDVTESDGCLSVHYYKGGRRRALYEDGTLVEEIEGYGHSRPVSGGNVQIAKDKSFCIVFDYFVSFGIEDDDEYTSGSLKTFWMNPFKKTHFLASFGFGKNGHKSSLHETVVLSPDDTQCALCYYGPPFNRNYKTKIDLYDIQRINYHSLCSMKIHNVFRWLVEFKEFEQDVYSESFLTCSELIQKSQSVHFCLENLFDLEEPSGDYKKIFEERKRKRKHLAAYANYYADRTEKFLEHK